MKIGVISDTHDNLESVRNAISVFEDAGVEKVIHCGDLISPFTAELFDQEFEFHAVRGNNDGEWDLKEAVEEFGEFYSNVAEFELEGVKVAAYHGTEEKIVEGLVSMDYDYVLRGHTHKRKKKLHGDTLELNPGGIELPGQEEDFSIAIIDLESGDVDFRVFG